jgi:thioredoxin reductase (NADPH)
VQTLLQDNQINFEFIDVETTEGASEFVMNANNGKRIIPTILFNDKAYPIQITLR